MEQKNCFHLHGGLSSIMARKYPQAAAADLATKRGDLNKLGTYQIINCGEISVINAYGQFSVGGKATDYDAWESILADLKKELENNSILSKITIKIPAFMGAGLGGGDFSVMYKLLDKYFGESKVVEILICVRDLDEEKFKLFLKENNLNEIRGNK